MWKPSWVGIRLPLWAAPAALYVLALAVRLPLLRVPIYGDEAVLYYLSRYPLQDAGNVHTLDGDAGFPISLLFWWRPFFRILFTPAALISFDAYRFSYILVTSLLAPVAYWLLRAYGSRATASVAAGVAVALWPPLVHWGVITFPDEPMMVAFALGLWASARGRPVWAAAAFITSIWLKEVAVVGVVVFMVLGAAAELRSRRASLWPLRLTERTTGLLAAIGLGLTPLLYYMSQGGARPGWTSGGTEVEIVERILPLLWMLPVLVVGLAWTRTRNLSVLALASPAFYFYYGFVLDGRVEAWYYVQPHFLAFVAAALVLDEWIRCWPVAAGRRAWAPRAAAVFLVGVFALQVLAPSTAAVKSELTAPITGDGTWGLAETIRLERARSRNLEDMVEYLEPEDLGTVFLVDLGWFFIYYPFAEIARASRYAYTDWYPQSDSDVERWARVVETRANATILGLHPPIRPLNEAIRNVYSDCVAYTNDEYVILRAQACAGRTSQLVEEYDRLSGKPLP